MTQPLKWTVCLVINGKDKKLCQYPETESGKVKADKHAKSIGGVAKLYPANPQRIAKVGGRRSCECLHKVGLPQYDDKIGNVPAPTTPVVVATEEKVSIVKDGVVIGYGFVKGVGTRSVSGITIEKV